MQNQKRISSLIGIVIIVAVAVATLGSVFAYQYFSTPKTETPTNQTTDLKVYKNEAAGYRLLYPTDLNIIQSNEIQGTEFEIVTSYPITKFNSIQFNGSPIRLNYDHDSYQFPTTSFTIYNWDNENTDDQDIKDKRIWSALFSSNKKIESIFMADGSKVEQIIDEDSEKIRSLAFIKKNNTTYEFFCVQSKIVTSRYSCSTFDYMLSTFEFTK